MRYLCYYIICITVVMMTLCSCSDEIVQQNDPSSQQEINLSGQIMQENVTRANDYGFVDGDQMGIYVVDYENGIAGSLSATANRASNVLFTYNAGEGMWQSSTTLYWRDEHTAIDVYGYYPGANYIASPTAYNFEVQSDQSTEAKDGDLSGYEQSDLLWGKATNVQPTTEQIVVKYSHILAGVRVKLQKGTGMTDTEWEKLEKTVLVDNTVRAATVDLSTGAVTVGTAAVSPVRMAPQSSGDYRAVVIPQTVAAGKQLVSITLDGQTYGHQLSQEMNYKVGKLHNFTLTINKREASGDYEVTLTSDGISDWTNDESSHTFLAMAYVTVHCPEAGTLKERITAAGYDYKTVQNLKVTGELTDADFDLLRQMSALSHLNLKDAHIKHVYHSYWTSNDNGSLVEYYMDDEFPPNAFYSNKNIRSLSLPSSLKRIGDNAFREMQLMYSTLEVPEGVTYIGSDAFSYNEYNGVELILPATLDSIEGSFRGCGYKCELKLPDNISHIAGGSFAGCDNFYGVFRLPSKLKSLDGEMFAGLGNNGSFTGEIELPQGFTEIPDASYWGPTFGVSLKNRINLTIPAGYKRIGKRAFGNRLASLTLNDDLEVIDNNAFTGSYLYSSITLPSGLRRIGYEAFAWGAIEGELVIPETCVDIDARAFASNELMKVTLPSRLEVIMGETFADNSILREVRMGQFIDFIGNRAFGGCGALQTIICLTPEPPTLGTDVFNDVFFDKCVLQVPGKSVEAYRHAEGWKQFKNITAYHELAFNVPEILCLDKGQTVEGVIRAEGAWEVSECPSWVTVSPMSGTGKEEVKVTVASGIGESREGRIVFSLKDKGYTTYTIVRQVISEEYAEDKTFVLQTASAGASRAIPIFIVGEGYSADDIASGQYLEDMKEQMEHLFSCEPYKTYRNYFTVSTAIAVSPESGINGRQRFEPENPWEGKDEVVWQYAKAHGVGITDEREGQTTILVLLNTNSLGSNGSSLSDNGRTISYLGKSNDSYPFSQREYVLREVGGIAFGHLGVESVNHFTFLKACTCPCCNGLSKYNRAKRLGWYENVSISGKMNDVPWSHLIFDERFAQYVDVYEGAQGHARGAYRSENMSIMGEYFIPYFNTISRQSIVKRILEYSGEGYTFDKFIANDKREYPGE